MKIIVKTQFEDYHKWSKAPKEVAFLRSIHRHIFFVEIETEVTHDDRELEFFMVKKVLDEAIERFIKPMPPSKSCEQMALKLRGLLTVEYNRDFIVRIFEDNQNGVEV